MNKDCNTSKLEGSQTANGDDWQEMSNSDIDDFGLSLDEDDNDIDGDHFSGRVKLRRQSSSMVFDPNDIDNLSALSYFPAKVLEIIDTYDVLYSNFSKDEVKGSIDNKVINFMYENFLENKIKIDPIIFSIFIKFIENIKNISVVDCPL